MPSCGEQGASSSSTNSKGCEPKAERKPLKEKRLKPLTSPDYNALEVKLRQGLPRTSKVHCTIAMCKHFPPFDGFTIYIPREDHLEDAKNCMILCQKEKLGNADVNLTITTGESQEEIEFVSLIIQYKLT